MLHFALISRNLFEFGEFTLDKSDWYNEYWEIQQIDIPPVRYITKSGALVVILDYNGDFWYMGAQRELWGYSSSTITKLDINQYILYNNNDNDYKTMTFKDFQFQIKLLKKKK